MGISYLDIEDEITTAVGRLRQSDDARVALVLPPGSRIATSRINFRLLAREAREHSRLLAIVTPEASVRAVAVSAGLPAYAAVSDYEAALAGGEVAAPTETTAPPGSGVPGAGGPPPTTAMAEALAAGGVGAALERTRTMPVATGAGGSAEPATAGRSVTAAPAEPSLTDRLGERLGDRLLGRLGLPDLPVRSGSQGQGGSRLLRWVTILVGLAIILAALGVAALAFLPSATITITPQARAIGPVELTVVADPAATAVDPSTLVVPAQTLSYQLSASDTFPSSGVKVHETKASGTVTFQNYDTGRSVTIPRGVVVNTSAGVGFATSVPLPLPRAQIVGRKTIVPGQANVSVAAVRAGPDGNVPANAITVVPQGYDPTLIAVFNAQPTSGGKHTETKIVAQKDYENAVAALTARLQTQLRDDLADPTQIPAGLTLFPESATMGKATADTSAKDVVGTAKEDFTLTVSATATATAVDKSQLAPLAESKLKAQVPAGYQLFSDSISSTVGQGTVVGDTVSFPVQATAQMWKPVDTAHLLDSIKGKTIPAAKAALAPLGEVAISAWPSWVTTIPTLDQRLSLTVAAPVRPSASPGSGGSPGASASPITSGPPSPTIGPVPSGTARPNSSGSPTQGTGGNASQAP
ncbi:MAG TPA: baseplate J/gp47 family protein [Candidatus Limnocylindrales bacterium]|nr:baseplate J/gp47 family protein [Candidatus Limnocylindrales bacterium]